MSDHPSRISVNSQGVVFDQQVVYEGNVYLANHSAAGVYHSFGKAGGHQLLDYCERCTDSHPNINRDSCLGDQLFAVDSFDLEAHHFVNQSG